MFVAASPHMARQQVPLELLALYALAAAGCKGDPPAPAAPDAGSGGRAAGTRAPDAGRTPDAAEPAAPQDAGAADSGSTPPRPKVGDACDAGTRFKEGAKLCADARIDWLQSCKARFEDTQCYLREDASPCLPASDPKLVDLLVDYVASAGFRAEFVIAQAPGAEVPASCDALLDCCSQLSVDYLRVACYDQLDDPERLPYCNDWTPTRLQPNVSCPPANVDADAGSHAGPRPSLCCYRTCGYIVDT
jgi:hypothetical protein